ncbi:Fe-S cluster assembly sulfur transfer protein SufU [Faecalispora anaeroviscerum]|uniref:Fe-S cluster assembly sulfur transfer protein SufU n=1 Tax=Faecalispora anaeroviscerum TaxID=2991836 RepID=UPI0024BABFD8|nr:SUF system NifU family Fe-S cluster assembly protein [Faecalispora anaeroviscerum]
MELNQIYTEIITENSRSKRNKRELENPTAVIKGVNPSCGDEISLQVREKDGIIEDASFTGVGCAISQASASIMIDLVKGKTIEEALHLANTFLSMIKEGNLDEAALDELEDAAAFQNISKMPARVKCAVLAWHTLEEAVQSDGNCPGDDSASCKTRI